MKTYVKELTYISNPSLQEFTKKLVPNTKYEILGVSTPNIKALVKKIGRDEEFLSSLPHKYHEENMMHGIMISTNSKDIASLIKDVSLFLPYVDNWAVCDSLLKPSNKFKKFKKELLDYAYLLIQKEDVYHIRFGLNLLLSHGLDSDINKLINESLKITNNDYYVEMMLAWLYATALINHEKEIIELLQNNTLSTFVHNKTIQKASESYRISDSVKTYLKTLKK